MEVIETSRLLLTPLTSDFLTERYVNWLNDPDVTRYMHPREKKETFDSLKDYLKTISENKILSWAIVLKNTNKHIGNIKIDPIDEIKSSGEYGIMIGDKSEWAKGYAKEATLGLFQYLKGNDIYAIKNITLGVLCSNILAIKFYFNLGFEVFTISEVPSQSIFCNNNSRELCMRMKLTL